MTPTLPPAADVKLTEEAEVRVPAAHDLQTPVFLTAPAEPPVWSWWTLLSLDAPTVALCWHVFLSRLLHVQVPVLTTVALITTVWLIYVADRLLDTRSPLPLTRHRFYLRHRRAIAFATLPALLLLAYSALHISSLIYTAIAPLIALALLHFVVVHHFSSLLQRFWPKELLVGAIFALGTALPVTAGQGRMWPYLAVFAALCWCNCVAIEHWEWSRLGGPVPNLWAVVLGPRLQLMAALIAVATMLLPPTFRSCQAAFLASAGLLAFIDFHHHSTDLDTLRVLADAALLTPALFLFA